MILQAPTGSGKTHAAMLPFLNALEHRRDFPTKCVYSVPMRVLANQFVGDYSEAVKRAGRADRIEVAIQTGERNQNPQLDANLIFATIDQTLSSFLLAPYSLPLRRANLNAAAVMGSYLVFDEFHLYDPDSTLPTALHMLQMLRGIVPFVLMTATFSRDMLAGLAKALEAEVVPGTDEEREQLQHLESQQKTRRYHVADGPLTAQAVLEKHQGRSLVICNTVDRARALYEALQRAKDPHTEVWLLHSRFLRKDRDQIEERLRARFAKNVRDGSLILVSTQAIEVGVDITSTALHTELAPANAILQRAGRCARYKDEEGDVYIYPYALDATSGELLDLCEHPQPYAGKEEKKLFAPTLEQFHERSGCVLNFQDEQDIISTVHGPLDQQIIEALRRGAYEHRKCMFAVMRHDDSADARHLIREIFQQQVTVHPNPDELRTSPFDAPSFGVHPGTLQKYITGWLEHAAELELPWAVKYLRFVPNEDDSQSNRSAYEWEEVYTPKTAWGTPLIVVHPSLATYDPALGFLPDRGGTWRAELPSRDQRSERPDYTYHLETYEDHIRRVHEAFEELWPELDYAARRLEARYGWPRGSVRRAAELAVLLHDVGKLSVKWQGWVKRYQEEIGMPVKAGQAYAHTEVQNEAHREAEGKAGRRPWHAVEGAIATAPILFGIFAEQPPLAKAAFSAIARHHAPKSDDNQPFRLVKEAPAHIRAVLRQGDDMGSWIENLAGLNEEIPSSFGAGEAIAQPEDDDDLASFLAYLLIVRALRRADQQGTERGTGI
ncbi:MAG: CRISPR-associated helicase Cas3' [Anaerolineae bacterium]|nr:CRISPR-associated helicase Cas3' [Anaerolineae bacterium]